MKAFLKPWWGKLIVAVVVLLLIGIAAAAYAFWQIREAFPRSIPFDATVWQAADTEELDNPRCLMRGDLEQHHLKLGMTKTDIVSILGEGNKETQIISYYIGFCRPFTIDATAMTLEFDNNKLTKIYDVQY